MDHINGNHGNVPVSQLIPVKPAGQSHTYLLGKSVQLPRTQGSDSHSFISGANKISNPIFLIIN